MERIFLFFLVLLFTSVVTQNPDDDTESVNGTSPFAPTVTATCSADTMTIVLSTSSPFYGIMVSSNNRNSSACYTNGIGGTRTVLRLRMDASINDRDYCGVSINYKNSEKTAQLSVRQNRVLELAEDKNYLVSCGKFESAPPTTPHSTSLGLYTISSNRQTLEPVNTHAYKLRVTTKSGTNFRIRNCFAFGSTNKQVELIDDQGCPASPILSRWSFTDKSAESTIFNMFRFQEGRQLTIQCHVLFCGSTCPDPSCRETKAFAFIGTDSEGSPAPLRGSNDTDVLVSTSVTVIDVGEKTSGALREFEDDEVCTGRFCPTWLLWLAIIFGVLFLIMLLVNLFLCTALTCTCTRTELVEKEPSIMDDYDPYNNRSSYFSGSHYSINQPKTYSELEHYAQGAQNSRPNSRFSK